MVKDSEPALGRPDPVTGQRSLWPSVSDLGGSDDWAAAGEDVRLALGIDAILARHGIAGPLRRFRSGSLPVYAVGEDIVLKLFGPQGLDFQRAEAAGLAAVEGRLSIPTPRLVAADALEGWSYVLMTRCSGSPLRELWPNLTADVRSDLVRAIGTATRELHGLSVHELEHGPLDRDWAAFMNDQRQTVRTRQQAKGLSEPWLDRLEAFVDDVALPTLEVTGRVLLHTELMREHVLAQPIDGRWRCTGLIDFEPSMLGERGYELASIGLFVTEGDSALWAAWCDGYFGGVPPPDLAAQCMAYALLHRYSNLAWYLERLPVPSLTTDLHTLANAWFA